MCLQGWGWKKEDGECWGVVGTGGDPPRDFCQVQMLRGRIVEPWGWGWSFLFWHFRTSCFVILYGFDSCFVILYGFDCNNLHISQVQMLGALRMRMSTYFCLDGFRHYVLLLLWLTTSTWPDSWALRMRKLRIIVIAMVWFSYVLSHVTTQKPRIRVVTVWFSYVPIRSTKVPSRSVFFCWSVFCVP